MPDLKIITSLILILIYSIHKYIPIMPNLFNIVIIISILESLAVIGLDFLD